MGMTMCNVIAAMIYVLLLLPYFFNDKYLSKSTLMFRNMLIGGLVSALCYIFKLSSTSTAYILWDLLMSFINITLIPTLYLLFNNVNDKHINFALLRNIALTSFTAAFAIRIKCSFIDHNYDLSIKLATMAQSVVFLMPLLKKYSNSISKTRLFVLKTLPILAIVFLWGSTFYTHESFFASIFSLICLSMVVCGIEDDYKFDSSMCLSESALQYDLEQMIAKNSSFVLITFSFDDYQYIYDVIGPQNTQIFVKTISQKIKEHFSSYMFNLGSGLFSFVLSGTYSEISEKIEELSKILSTPIDLPRTVDTSLTPRICIAEHPSFASSADNLIDAACFSLKNDDGAKHCGNVIVASSEALEKKKREIGIIHAIKNAVKNGSFKIYYQPLLNVQNGKFDSAEALIRMFDDKLGFVSPEEFIPIAERNGLITEIGEIVLRNVCCFIQCESPETLGINHIGVNLSTIQCMHDRFSEQLLDIMKEYGVSPCQINFEITETAKIINEDSLKRNMNELISSGSHFSMDDYGTGFSTENYLIALPMQIVKIDKSILWPAMNSHQAFIMLAHTIQMLKALDKKIVVEGVETEEMANALIDLGCDYLQGFYFSKPIPEKDYLNFLKAHNSGKEGNAS